MIKNKNTESEFVDKSYLDSLFSPEETNESPEKEDKDIDIIEKPDESIELEEEEKPEVTTEESVDLPPSSNDNEESEEELVSLRDVIGNLIETQVWTDASIQYNDKTYGSFDELLDEVTPTKELFEELIEVQKGLKEEELQESYLKLDSKDPTRIKVAKAVLTGEEYQEIVDKNTEIEYLKNYDLTNEENAIRVIALYYRDKKNFDIENDPDHIEVLKQKIKSLKEKGEILEKAESFRNEIVDDFDNEVERKLEEESQKIEDRKKEERNKKKDFRDRLKSRGFSDTFIKQAQDLRFGKHKELIDERSKDTEDFDIDYVYFLINPKEYINNKSQKKVLDTQRKMITIVGKKASSSKKTKTQEEDESFTSELDTIFKGK